MYRSPLLCLSVAWLTLPVAGAQTQLTVHVDAVPFGLASATVDDPADDDALGIQNAIDALVFWSSVTSGPSTHQLVFSPGVYTLDMQSGMRLLEVTQLADLEIVGSGATLELRGYQPTAIDYGATWTFDDCDDLTVRDLAFTMVRRAHTAGVVTGPPVLQPSGGQLLSMTLDEPVPAGFKIRWASQFEWVAGVPRFSSEHFSGGGFEEGVHYVVHQPASGSSTQVEIEFRDVPGQQNLASLAAALSSGDTLQLTHQKYRGNPFVLLDCDRVLMEGIHFQDSAGMGATHFDCSDVTARNITASAAPGAVLSLTADGLNHFRTTGKVVVEDCDFAQLGDDALNVHAYYYKVIERSDHAGGVDFYVVEDDTSFESGEPPLGPWSFFGADLVPVGKASPSNVACVAAGTPQLGKLPPQSGSWNPSCGATSPTAQMWLVQFTSPTAVPGVSEGDYLIPHAHLPSSVAMRNCTVEDSLVRGGLISVPNVSIEGCTFRRLGGPAIAFTTDIGVFDEGPGVTGGAVRGCIIEDVCVGRVAQTGAISIYAYLKQPGSPHEYSPAGALGDIEIDNNYIGEVPYDGVLVASADSVRVTNNLFFDVAQANANPPAVPAFHASIRPLCMPKYYGLAVFNSADVLVDGNAVQTALYQQGSAFGDFAGTHASCGAGSAITLGPNNLLY